MLVLLDESLPQELAAELAPIDVRTVAELGWSGLANGALLGRAESAHFTVFVTADQNIPYQQNLRGAGLGVIVLRARSNRIEDLIPLVPALVRAVNGISDGQFLQVGPEANKRR